MLAVRKQLAPDRFRRLWAMAQLIADTPGLSREALSERYSIGPRQMQADINCLRDKMGLPLVRSQGYRMVDADGATVSVNMRLWEVALLCDLLAATPLAPRADRLVPPHWRPLASRLLDPTTRPIMAALTRAILAGGSVRLRGQGQYEPWTATVWPELLLPYLGAWYALGTVRAGGRRRSRMLPLAQVVSVEEGGFSYATAL